MSRRRAAVVCFLLAEAALLAAGCTSFGEGDDASPTSDATTTETSSSETGAPDDASADTAVGADAPFALDCRSDQFCDAFDDAGPDAQGRWTFQKVRPPYMLGVVPNVAKSPMHSLQVSHPAHNDAGLGAEAILGKEITVDGSGMTCTFSLYVEDIPADFDEVFRVFSVPKANPTTKETFAFWSLRKSGVNKVEGRLRFNIRDTANVSVEDEYFTNPATFDFSTWLAVQLDLDYAQRSLALKLGGQDAGVLAWTMTVPARTASQTVRIGLTALTNTGSANVYYDDVKCAARP